MRRVFIFLFILIPFLLQGQDKQIIVRNFNNAGVNDMRARTSPVMDHNQRLTALIEITMPVIDSTINFEGIVGTPLLSMGSWLVHVAEGTKLIEIWVPGCYPFEYSFTEDIESGRVYELSLDVVETIKDHTLILPIFSYNLSQYSYGIMFGHLWKLNGFYIEAKTDFTFGLNTSYDCNEEGIIDGIKGWFTGDSRTSRLSFSAGYLRQLMQTRNDIALYAFGGGGYGKRLLAWQISGSDNLYDYARVTPYSFNGYEAEVGIIFRKGSLAVMSGIQTIQFKYLEANVGIGVKF